MKTKVVFKSVVHWVALAFLLGACSPGQVYDTSSRALDCLPDDANAMVFDQAVCLCGDLDKVGYGITSSSFSSFGRRTDTLRTAHVGINGEVRSQGVLKVDGDLDVAGMVDTDASVMIKRDLLVGGELLTHGHTSIDGNASVAGVVDGMGGLEVAGRLEVGGEITMTGNLRCGDVATGVPFAAHTPCPCDPYDLIDVAAEVAAHSGAQPIELLSGKGKSEIVLSGGDYYAATGSFLQGNTRFKVQASSRLFVDGDLEFMGGAFVELEEGAELDIYIAGSVHKIGNLQVGWPMQETASRAIRVYIGGSDDIALDVTGNTRFKGAVYAPTADILYQGNLIIEGSLFARNVIGRGHLLVRYDAGLVGGGCDPDDPGGGDPVDEPDDDWECIPGDDAFPCPGETGYEDGEDGTGDDPGTDGAEDGSGDGSAGDETCDPTVDDTCRP